MGNSYPPRKKNISNHSYTSVIIGDSPSLFNSHSHSNILQSINKHLMGTGILLKKFRFWEKISSLYSVKHYSEIPAQTQLVSIFITKLDGNYSL